MRVVALLATYNEERCIATCLEGLFEQGLEVVLIDNCSTDRTIAIAERYRGQGLIDIETLPREGVFSLRRQMERKEQLTRRLDADWFMHLDADEIRLSPWSGMTLAEAFARVEREGYNAVNFVEYTFIPTREAPNHDHPHYRRTMRWYYPFVPPFTHGLKAWKRQPDAVELAWSGGHRVRFPGIRMHPIPFPMLHYQFLSVQHAVEKYVNRRFAQDEIADGWHGWRASLRSEALRLPPTTELREFVSVERLDATNPRTQHFLTELLAAYEAQISAAPSMGQVNAGR